MIGRFLWHCSLALGAYGSLAAQSDPSPRPAPQSPFPIGERLFYDARLFGILPLGTAEMRVVGIDTIRQTPAVHIRFVIQSGTYLYRLNNRMDSWIALADTSSRRFTQDFDEAGKQRHTSYDILPDSGYYRQKGVDSLLPTVERPLDDAAFFYFIRTTPIEAGKRYEIPRYFRPDRNPVVLDVRGRDTLDVPAGRFPSLLVHPIIKGRGILAEASEARLWLSDDDRRIVVQLKSKFSFGIIALRLIRIETGADSAPGQRR